MASDDPFADQPTGLASDSSDTAPLGTAAHRRKDDTEALTAIASSREPLQIGPYRILGVIGRGGMGTVYRAEVVLPCAIPVGRTVAIKLLRQIADRGERLRFGREASYLQALRHTGIVRVLDVGDHLGQPYLVMELVEGQPLNHLIAGGGRLDEAQVADIAIRALEALHVAHLAGIVHRDIKPSNIMISPDGSVKLVDFGLAQRMDASSTLTATGTVIGTPAYMSPEQAAGERHSLGRRSDIYSLGACCYELLTGHQPFVAETSVAVLRKILDDPLDPPSLWRPGLSRDLETIVLKAMCKHPADRYPNAEAMAVDLRAFRRGLRIKSRRPSRLVPLLRAAWHHRRAVASVGLVVFVVLALIGVAVRQVLILLEQHPPGTVVVPPRPAQPPTPTWITEWSHEGPLSGDTLGVARWRQAPNLGGKETWLATLRSAVNGPVRLRVSGSAMGSALGLDLMVRDRDIGRGYRARLRTADNVDQVILLRDDKVVASHAIPRLRGQFAFTLEAAADAATGVVTVLTVTIEGPAVQAVLAESETAHELQRAPDRLAFTFEDLVPLGGQNASAIHVAIARDQIVVDAIQVARLRVPPIADGLVMADILRQEGNLNRAIDAYDNFINDNPNHRLVRDAKLRKAICLEEKSPDAALPIYLEVVRENRDQPRYVLYSTFRAWIVALRLGRYQEAEQYLDFIRSKHSLPQLLVTVQQPEIEKVLRDYEARAEQLTPTEPRRAASLHTTAGDLARYLGGNRWSIVFTNLYAAAGLLLGLGENDEALATLLAASANQAHFADDQRLRLRVRIADCERLLGRDDAIRHYQEACDLPPGKHRDELAWPRLWLGDLLLEQHQRDRARSVWSEDAKGRKVSFGGPGGEILRHLLDHTDSKHPHPNPTEALQVFTDRAQFEKAQAESRAQVEKAQAESRAAEKAAAEKAAAEKAAAEKAAAEKAAAERAAAEKAAADKAAAEKAAAKGDKVQVQGDKAAADKAPADKAPADKAAADKAPADKAAAEKAAAEKAAADKAAADKAAAEKRHAEKRHAERMPARILVDPRSPLINDIEYLNARLAFFHGDLALYRERLEALVRTSAAHDWPAPLARHLLAQLPPPPPPTPESTEPPPAP